MPHFLAILTRRPDLDPAVVPRHAAYLEILREQGTLRMSGAFGDHTGGAYLLEVADLAEAQAIVARDPASIHGGWDIVLKEWRAR